MRNYRLNLIRHGYTDGNILGKYVGLTDLPLCDEGEGAITALTASELYPRVQKVYTSPLLRCLQTAEIIYPNNLIKKIDNIGEYDFGDFEGKTPDELAHLPEYKEWLKGGYNSAPPNGESYEEFTLRCLAGLDEIFHDMMQNQITDASLITHSGVIMNLLSNQGLPKGKPVDFATKQGEGFQIILSTFLWQKGNAFEIAGKLF